MAHITTSRRKELEKKPDKVGLPSRDKAGPRGGAPKGDYPTDTKKRARAAKAYASKEEHAGKLSKSQEREIDRRADKELGKGKSKTISPKSEHEHVHIRKIANGYMVRHTTNDPKHGYMETEHYSDEAPKIRVR